jgi:hypothetical protein
VARLACSPYLARLEELNLGDNLIQVAGARALATAAGLGRLRKLDLRNTSIGWDEYARLQNRFLDAEVLWTPRPWAHDAEE